MIPRQIATYRIREYLIESFAMFIIHNNNESNLQQMCRQINIEPDIIVMGLQQYQSIILLALMTKS